MTPTGTEAEVCRGSASRLDGALPCPFCGSSWIVKGQRYFAMCVDCGATGPERNGDASRKKFTGDWNSRTIQAAKEKDAEIARLREALAEYGDHVGVCPKKYSIDKPCECGFEAALCTNRNEPEKQL